MSVCCHHAQQNLYCLRWWIRSATKTYNKQPTFIVSMGERVVGSTKGFCVAMLWWYRSNVNYNCFDLRNEKKMSAHNKNCRCLEGEKDAATADWIESEQLHLTPIHKRFTAVWQNLRQKRVMRHFICYTSLYTQMLALELVSWNCEMLLTNTLNYLTVALHIFSVL